MSRKILLGLFLFITLLPLHTQSINQMHFQDQPIRDILMALAEVSGRSIIADETIDGRATYFFSNTDFDKALTQFLQHYGIFHRYEEGTWYVSRIETEFENGTFSCRAENVDLQILIRRLSRDGGITLLHDVLPREQVNVNFQSGSMEDLLNIIIRPYPQFYLEKGDQYFYLRKENNNQPGSNGGSRGREYFSRESGRYSADFLQVRFREALGSLMDAEEREYAFLGRNDSVIEQFRFSDKSFDEMLKLLLEQGNAAYTLSGDIYYITDLDRQDILKSYYATLFIPLQNISVDRLSSLIPSSFSNSGAMKLDKENNAVLLTGSLMEISPLEKFLKLLDNPPINRNYRRFDLQFLTVEDFQKKLTPSLAALAIIPVEEKSFVSPMEDEKASELQDYLTLVDKPSPVWPVKLHYLTWENLQENLPPSVDAEQLSPGPDNRLFFFKGTAGEWNEFQRHLEELDKPRPQIRYEVLVLQIEDFETIDLDTGLEFGLTGPDSSMGFSGSLKGLSSLNFDIISQFGYQFAVDLSISLTENRSRVLADTTLFGLSGEEIRFQNTNTSRIPTRRYDPDNADTEIIEGYGEITSGLIVEIEGWVSGDDMITIQVQSTISEESGGSQTNDDSIPTTTEKVISTHVRSPSGQAIILSGLKQRKTVEDVNKVPILGDIPLIGRLFQNRLDRIQNTEFLITLIPYREEEYSGEEDSSYLNIYRRLVQGEQP